MLLTCDDGTVVDLRPVGWENPEAPADDPVDADWLLVRGDVQLPDGTAWSFTDPALLLDEARALGRWLREAAAGRVRVEPTPGRPTDREQFLEPVLGTSLAHHVGGGVTVRVHLAHEASPPGHPDPSAGVTVTLRTTPAALVAAADAWDAQTDEVVAART
ncbi:WapI family immunity protein [Cellulomonas oligotrophica]|uniref:Uncharacterized protein n=1 Tax=Cellulomonas oligotrophica TaxID=931536 RepID=A0A7Y9JYG9_9CELL|nr:hypothetical protein [Cellulomonas oligotrophica]NYD86732.1 hypothetical protein [Cellulomonas oligotrophica]GIG32482.1 hypothetical protein Col01nite_16410 [Cellulomonas oligotrophica]